MAARDVQTRTASFKDAGFMVCVILKVKYLINMESQRVRVKLLSRGLGTE